MSNFVPEDVIEDIRNANDIVDVISDYVQLKKQGRNYFGLCPFHDEKTPSFSVTKDKQIFHCFGCGKGGNVITFLMELEGFTFIEAITYLADRRGIELPQSIRQSTKTHTTSSSNEQILSAYKWLEKLYHYLLRFSKDGQEGKEYIAKRGLTNETVDLFKLGYAPNEKTFTASFLKKKGFHLQLLQKAGILVNQSDGEIIDRFFGRVIFPIRNHLGITVGFGARSIDKQEPKYLNSSESSLFQKSKILYNFDLAKKYIRKENEAILFEGYMDVITAYQAGIKNVVATMGTSLTESQARLLRRYVDTVTICYDSDEAGIEATYRAARLLEQVDCHVKIAVLKNGVDPDTYIQTYGGDNFINKVLQPSETFMSFYMRYLKKDFKLQSKSDQLRYIQTVLKELANINSSIEREYYLKILASEFNFTLESLNQEIKAFLKPNKRQQDNRKKDNYTNKNTKHFYAKNQLLPAFHKAERQLIVYMLQDRTITDKVKEELGASFNIDQHKIIVTHLYAYYEEGNPPDISLFIEKLKDEKLKHLVAEITMTSPVYEVSDDEINDYIRIIREEYEDVSYINQLKREQKMAEQQNDPITAAKIGLKILEQQKSKNTDGNEF
ncbi:DNA primase [Cerasibacillus quisquiliarum]|uniref:DNA primase n=1 Tax=Cerasibacillus quisquiliarum TaxID=227865 RepID=A0A511UZA1_9BACI|nr:DNA primase [Cerasibacillus quisquiliarum]MBB5145527.1 DNA primase [Cerasibacillus quisquiliarum]GEN31078.1 DNA primase [Cerasibacillus quisquiliarum]